MLPLAQDAFGDWRLNDAQFLASRRMPTDADRIDVLRLRHPMQRESRISFDAETHLYKVDGTLIVPRSVTGLLKEYGAEFDAHRAAELMLANEQSRRREAYRKPEGSFHTPEEVVAQWIAHGNVQRARGQLLHFQAEQLVQGRSVEEPWSPELQQASAIWDALQQWGLRALRTEVSIFHCGLRVAGQPDLLAVAPDGSLIVIDWKRCAQLDFDCRFRTMKPPLEHLPDSKFWKYALQVRASHEAQEKKFHIFFFCHRGGEFVRLHFGDRVRPSRQPAVPCGGAP